MEPAERRMNVPRFDSLDLAVQVQEAVTRAGPRMAAQAKLRAPRPATTLSGEQVW